MINPAASAEFALRNSFSVIINNQSGSRSSYGIFSAPPTITPALSTTVNSTIIAAVPSVSSGAGQAMIILPKQLYAICGTNISYGTDEVTKIEVMDKRPVTLGVIGSDGKLIPGTTLQIVVHDKEAPAFSTETKPADSGVEGAFCLKTAKDFTIKDAIDGHFYLGYGGSNLNMEEVGSYASFSPIPNATLQILPKNIFFIVIGQFEAKEVVKDATKASALEINFDELGSNSVQIVHDSHGNLVIQKGGF